MPYDIERSRGVEPRPAAWMAAVQAVSLAPLNKTSLLLKSL